MPLCYTFIFMKQRNRCHKSRLNGNTYYLFPMRRLGFLLASGIELTCFLLYTYT